MKNLILIYYKNMEVKFFLSLKNYLHTNKNSIGKVVYSSITDTSLPSKKVVAVLSILIK